MSNDFHPDHNTARAFLDDPYARQLASIRSDSDLVFCVSYMTDREVRESIVDDVLATTIWENQNPEHKLYYDLTEMVRFVDEEHRSRVLQQLVHPEIAFLLTETNGQYRVINNPEILKAAMDYAGVWYDGFTPTAGTEVLSLNKDKINEAVAAHGSLENLAKHLAVELEMTTQTNAPTSETLQ